jgi:signal recognition particle subunit SRP54
VFDTLSTKLDDALDRVKGRGRLDEKTVDATLKEIRLALLEADVNFKVVKGVVERLRERLVGADVAKALNPSQQVIKAVDAELTRALGGDAVPLDLSGPSPHVLVLAGLQGSGKTTAAGKLAAQMKRRGHQVMLVACDLQRPAAVQQLQVNAEKVGVTSYAPATSGDPVPVARDGLAAAKADGCDVVIVDTAGRLDVDAELLDQAAAIKDAVGSTGGSVTTMFVIDAMIGQEAVNVAKAFQTQVGFDGVILAKLDGDARGGAALSVREVTGTPILFASVGEKMDDFEAFHPDRMASRILGMGDVMTLIERAEETYSEEEAASAEAALMSGQFTLEDFLQQMQMLKKMGPLQGLLGMLPGMGKQLKDVEIEDSQVARIEAIIRSMTPKERGDPKVLNGRRRKRIAAGSGTTVTEVNRLVKQFADIQKVMKSASKMAGGGPSGKAKGGHAGGKGKASQAAALRQMQSGALPGGGMPGGPGGMGGFTGLQPAPKKGNKKR